jgi:DNA-binding beta-propeller fold protein YncE
MGNNAIRRIDTSGNVTTFAGSATGQAGDTNGKGTAALFCMPMSVVFNPADNSLYVADGMNNEIRKIDLAGNVTTYAGSSTGVGGSVDGSLTVARFNCPMDLVILNGFMYVTDTLNNTIRRIDMSNKVVSTYIS